MKNIKLRRYTSYNLSTETSAELFHAEIKAFRSQFRRARNVEFLLF